MKERPILFSSAMVRAILAGQKTVTRRLVKWKTSTDGETKLVRLRHGEHCGSYVYLDFDEVPGLSWRPYSGSGARPFGDAETASPYGVPGDRLWVRETWADVSRAAELSFSAVYRADGDEDSRSRLMRCVDGSTMGVTVQKWKSPRFMPRWASRLTLEVTSVGVERLHAISEEDAKAEGVEQFDAECFDPASGDFFAASERPPVERFRLLWDSINAKRAPWSANPWVWVVRFRRVA